MPPRRTAATSAASTTSPKFVELTQVLGETRPQHSASGDDEDMDFGVGEDDALETSAQAPTAAPAAEGPTEITHLVMTRPDQIRYFYPRRDRKPGHEIHYLNGHVKLVQDSTEDMAVKFPGFVPVHSIEFAPEGTEFGSTAALPQVSVNPDAIREFFAAREPDEHRKSRIYFPNGNKFFVAESYDELKALGGVAPAN
jgi:hypothetical protein